MRIGGDALELIGRRTRPPGRHIGHRKFAADVGRVIALGIVAPVGFQHFDRAVPLLGIDQRSCCIVLRGRDDLGAGRCV